MKNIIMFYNNMPYCIITFPRHFLTHCNIWECILVYLNVIYIYIYVCVCIYIYPDELRIGIVQECLLLQQSAPEVPA